MTAAPTVHPATESPATGRLRVLALVGRLKWSHLDYLHALAERVELTVGCSGAAYPRAVERSQVEGLSLVPVGRIGEVSRDEVRARLAELLETARPDVVHALYYRHEELVLLTRELAGDRTPIVFEIRDPLTTLSGAEPGSSQWELEAAALAASDGHIAVSRAMLEYLDDAHGLGRTPSLVVPHAFARRNMAPPSDKLSARDGRVHVAIVGTADDRPGRGRWYVDIVRRLVAQGLVVHTRFHDLKTLPADKRVSLDVYHRLAAELPDYHHEPKIPFRWGTSLSEATSQYDLMGVFHELDAEHRNESATLAVCLPTKAVSGWFHGGIPVVCTGHYRGIVERVEEHGIGFVVDSIDDVWRVAEDREAIESATARCLAVRERFTHEHQAAQIEPFYRALVAPRTSGGRP